MPAVRIPGRARSYRELIFAADARACEHCAAREPADWRIVSWTTASRPDRMLQKVHASCPACQAERAYIVESDRDLIGARSASYHLGGPEPSEILSPRELVAEADRLAATLASCAPVRDLAAAKRRDELFDRVQTALTELAKFIPPDQERVPEGAHRDELGRADQRERPEQYTRQWIDAELARWHEAQVSFVRPAGKPVRPRVGLLRADLAAHRAWLRRGREGAGRLELCDVDVCPARLGAQDLTGSTWERVSLARGDLEYCHLSEAVLSGVDLVQARLSFARIDGARLDRCALDGAVFVLGTADGAVLDDCSLERLWMERSSWRGARVTRSRLRAAVFSSSWLDGVRFADCDLRRVLFSPRHPVIRGSAAGAVFERCDLRDADFTGCDLTDVTFADCKLRGATGAPSASAGLRVLDGDFSAAGDGSDLGGTADLLTQFGQERDPRMADRAIRYSVGSERNAADPWGRSELVMLADGRTWLEHYFADGTAGSWTGQADPAALTALWAGLDLAGFPEVPPMAPLASDATVHRLTVETDGIAQEALVSWDRAPELPGYAEACAVIDAVIRNMSAGAALT